MGDTPCALAVCSPLLPRFVRGGNPIEQLEIRLVTCAYQYRSGIDVSSILSWFVVTTRFRFPQPLSYVSGSLLPPRTMSKRKPRFFAASHHSQQSHRRYRFDRSVSTKQYPEVLCAFSENGTHLGVLCGSSCTAVLAKAASMVTHVDSCCIATLNPVLESLSHPLVPFIANHQVPFPGISFSPVEEVGSPILADLPLLHVAHSLGT